MCQSLLLLVLRVNFPFKASLFDKTPWIFWRYAKRMTDLHIEIRGVFIINTKDLQCRTEEVLARISHPRGRSGEYDAVIEAD
jgi:hypothetical protein